MLAIRMKRTGRRGHAQYRVVVQDSRYSPSSGRVVAFLGSYDPHTKVAVLDKEKAVTYLGNGAHPSDRAAKLLKKEGVELPKWVKISSEKERSTKNPTKLRRNQPKDETPAKEVEPASDEAAAEEQPAAEAAEESPQASTEPAEEPIDETPKAETKVEPEEPSA
jgi:small subunit ribosomal protein S16